MPESFQTVFGRGLVPELKTFVHRPHLVVTMPDLWARFRDDFDDGLVGPLLVSSLERVELDAEVEGLPRCEAVIGLGGGQALDVAKYVAWKRRLPLFQVPTALSVNAAWGHRAAVRVDGVVRYVGYAVPEAVYVDFDVVQSAPAELNRSGAGDILCYWTGHWDWRMAADVGKIERRWPYDERLVKEARVALDRVIDNADEIHAVSDAGVRALAESLSYGGSAFHNAGWNPRHIEGAEHFVFYALEYLTGKHFLHGQPVTLGILLMSHLQGNDPDAIRAVADRIGDADWPDRDRFVLSAGHASMLLYSVLYLTGYGLALDDLKQFRQLGSPTAGHPEREDAPGIETTTGPLGQGISTAAGLALGERMLAARFNRPSHEIVDHHTFVIASDGDMQEGVQSEASSLAGHLRLGRLVVFYDDNHISIEGDTHLSFSENVGGRYEAYGWHVQDLGENLELDALERATRTAMDADDRPSLVIVRSHIAEGSPNKQDTAGAHGSPLGEEEVNLTKQAYGWPNEEPFFVPEEALEWMRGCGERGERFESEWRDRTEAYRAEQPELWAEFERIVERRLPEGWDADTPRFTPDIGAIATRKASNQVIQWAAARVPELVGGSADLAPSTLTLIDDGANVEAGEYGGRNLHFGIREHGMGAIVNGLTLHGFRAFGATFLIFSDYMKGAIRLAALMEAPSIFCFTHDSIGLGEDGPTHQPVEQLVSLRATPNLYVVRPAGANETALAWRFAISQEKSPTALALSRQGLPVWDPAAVPEDAVDRGAYVLRREPGDSLDVILIGTGSELHVCAEAVSVLEEAGVSARLVSMPCMERFAEQDQAYRDEVLPPSCRARVCVEAASPVGWERWATEDGDIVGMTGFGASAPQKALYEHFGFTGEKVAERARAVVDRVAAGS